MLGTEVLDVAIGVIFVFLLVSLIASTIREGIEGLLKTRAAHLERGIRELLQDRAGTGLAKQFFEHPLIFTLYQGDYTPRKPSKWPISLSRGRNLPSYIPSRNYALALMDMAARGPDVTPDSSHANSGPLTLKAVRSNISLIQCPPVQRALLTAIDTAQGDLQRAQANIEAWYDSAMDRVSGWYKRSTYWMLFVIGFSLAALMNIGPLSIAEQLHRDKATRETLVARAQSASDPNYDQKKYADIKSELQSQFSIPIGRDEKDYPRVAELKTVSGWLLTGLAASLGAPFWFDLLNKIMVIRSTVKPHEKSPEESSEDRQAGGEPAKTTAATSQSPAGAAAPPQQAAPQTAAPAPPPADAIDGCDVQVASVTQDEDLPHSEGGVR